MPSMPRMPRKRRNEGNVGNAKSGDLMPVIRELILSGHGFGMNHGCIEGLGRTRMELRNAIVAKWEG